jgi:ketosteroid isomerase-like protein
MNATLLTTVAALAITAPFIASNARAADKPATVDEKALRKLDRDWVDAENRHDARALQAILDKRFIATFGAGKPLGKDAFIKQATSGPADPTMTQDLSDETIIVVGDTAVIVATDTVHKLKDGLPSAKAYRLTVTYIRRGGHWIALAEQADAIKPR